MKYGKRQRLAFSEKQAFNKTQLADAPRTALNG